MSEILLFTSKSCMHCPAEREFLKEKRIEFVEVDVYSDQYEQLKNDLLKNGITLQFVPAIVKKDGYKMALIERQSL